MANENTQPLEPKTPTMEQFREAIESSKYTDDSHGRFEVDVDDAAAACHDLHLSAVKSLMEERDRLRKALEGMLAVGDMLPCFCKSDFVCSAHLAKQAARIAIIRTEPTTK